MKTEQRKRDEAAMKFAGFLGHTFFEVTDDPNRPGESCVRSESGSLASAQQSRREDSRIYQKLGKRKYKLVDPA